MSRMDRRRFLLATAAATASLKSFAQHFPSNGGPTASRPAPQLARPPRPEGPILQSATLTLHMDQAGPAIPPNFVGLSYETQQLSEPEFFSPANTGLVAQFRELAPIGVLRLGGNTSDYGFWKPTPDAIPPPRPSRPYKVGDPPPDLIYDVTPEAVRNLRGFLDATGWTCLYGINLGTNTPEHAADEAAFVTRTLGPRLEYFQVGNEADRFGSTIRDPKTWNANTYFDDWLTFANAICARVPSAQFGLPDTAGNPEWYAVVVTRLLALSAPPNVAALTHHYYFTGPPSNPKATIEHLLHPDPHVDKLAADIRAAAARLGEGERRAGSSDHRTVLYRMTEGNTCYRGGKPGFSDVFAASLWAADYLLLLASLGYAGANLHGGQPKFVAESLGGTLPGEALLTDPNQPHPLPFYTPIADIDGKFVAEPVSFGMRFARHFAGATLIAHDFDPGPANATAYAAKFPDGRTVAAIVNKDPERILMANIAGFRRAEARTLEAASLTDTDVMWNENAPRPAGYIPSRTERLLIEGGQPSPEEPLQVRVAPASAVLLDSLE